MKRLKGSRLAIMLLMACVLMMGLAGTGEARRRHRRYYRNPEAGKRKAAKRIGVGAAIGAGAGALTGGRKGAAIGAGLGAGAGTAYHYHKKHKARRRRY